MLRRDNQLIVITHLSQLVTFVIGFGSLILPLVLWLMNKDKIYHMNEHGKEIVNFQLSLIVYSIICVLYDIIVMCIVVIRCVYATAYYSI